MPHKSSRSHRSIMMTAIVNDAVYLFWRSSIYRWRYFQKKQKSAAAKKPMSVWHSIDPKSFFWWTHVILCDFFRLHRLLTQNQDFLDSWVIWHQNADSKFWTIFFYFFGEQKLGMSTSDNENRKPALSFKILFWNSYFWILFESVAP